MKEYIDHLDKTWLQAVSQMEIDQDFVHNLQSFHLGYGFFNKSLFKQHLVSLAQLFINFVRQDQGFFGLEIVDQRRLLTRNVPLLIQFIFAKYLISNEDEQQVRWLLQKTEIKSAKPIDLHQFFARSGLFEDNQNMLTSYENEVKKFANVQCKTSLIALACIYQYEANDILEDSSEICNQNSRVKSAINWSCEAFGTLSWYEMSKMMTSLQEMSNLFDALVNWECEVTEINPFRREVAIAFTFEEDTWKNKAIKDFQRANSSIFLGENLLSDMIMRSVDIPVGKDFTTKIVGVFGQRMLQVLMEQNPFHNLTNLQQIGLLRKNLFSFSAMIAIYGTSCKDALTQFKFIMGVRDKQLYTEKFFLDETRGKRLKKILMTDCNKDYDYTDVPLQACIKWDDLCDACSKKNIFKFQNIFELFSLYLLTSVDGLSGNFKAMRALNKEYLSLLWMECCKNSDFSPREFRDVLSTVDQMASVMIQAPVGKVRDQLEQKDLNKLQWSAEQNGPC